MERNSELIIRIIRNPCYYVTLSYCLSLCLVKKTSLCALRSGVPPEDNSFCTRTELVGSEQKTASSLMKRIILGLVKATSLPTVWLRVLFSH